MPVLAEDLRQKYLDQLRDRLIGIDVDDPPLAMTFQGGVVQYDRSKREIGTDGSGVFWQRGIP